ncbi:MAG: hypothetical protein ACLPX1_04080 [Steroidobacteraceae bacterium]
MSQPLLSLADEAPLDPADVVCDILRDVESLPRLMEVHYLMQEPGLIELIRGLGALPDCDRFRLSAYLARHRQARLRVRQLPAGALILEAADETRLDESA